MRLVIRLVTTCVILAATVASLVWVWTPSEPSVLAPWGAAREEAPGVGTPLFNDDDITIGIGAGALTFEPSGASDLVTIEWDPLPLEIYETEAQLLTSTSAEGTTAYAEDTSVLYYRVHGAWATRTQ